MLAKERVSAMGSDYLVTEIRERLHRGPIKFVLRLQVADESDTIDDPSVRKAVADRHTAEKKLLFMPGSLVRD